MFESDRAVNNDDGSGQRAQWIEALRAEFVWDSLYLAAMTKKDQNSCVLWLWSINWKIINGWLLEPVGEGPIVSECHINCNYC